MKLVFHIPRMNWYRVLSPLINEALSRGHQVECWHHSGAKTLGENRPNRSKVPVFKTGTPQIVDYENPEDIIRLVRERTPTAIIDIYPPRYKEILEEKQIRNGWPFWLLVDLPPSDCILEIQSDIELFGCDGFAICNDFYFDSSIRYGMQNKLDLLSDVQSKKRDIGTGISRWIANRFMYQLNDARAQYLRDRTIIVGNAGLDHYALLNRADNRKRLNIPENKPVIVLLPCPFGYDLTAPWEQIFIKDSFLKRLFWITTSMRFDCLYNAIVSPSNSKVVSAIRAFSDKNSAFLVAKLRHSRKATPELIKNCQMLIGEDSYYPHTAAVLFSIADLVIGYYSSGAIEAVALGVPYLNIEIPGFPKKILCDTYTTLQYCDSWEDVVWSMTATEVINNLPLQSLDYYKISSFSRENYLRKFASWPLGQASARILDYLEDKCHLAIN